MQTNLPRLAEVFGGIRDPRSKQGTNLPLSGLLAGQNYFAPIQYWVENHWRTLQKPLGFKTPKPNNAVPKPCQYSAPRTTRCLCDVSLATP